MHSRSASNFKLIVPGSLSSIVSSFSYISRYYILLLYNINSRGKDLFVMDLEAATLDWRLRIFCSHTGAMKGRTRGLHPATFDGEFWDKNWSVHAQQPLNATCLFVTAKLNSKQTFVTKYFNDLVTGHTNIQWTELLTWTIFVPSPWRRVKRLQSNMQYYITILNCWGPVPLAILGAKGLVAPAHCSPHPALPAAGLACHTPSEISSGPPVQRALAFRNPYTAM